MQSEEITQKQNLLQNEIVNKNYDKTEFINFCMSKKENGDDLNNWALDELNQIIQEFIQSQKKDDKIEENKDSNPQEKFKPEDEIKTENVEKIEKFNAEEHKTFKERKIECKTLKKTDLNDKEIKVTVKNPREIEGGVFSKSYVMYDVCTEPLNTTVQRRYSDFDSLRKLIQKYYPSFYVPPLPDKKMGNKRFTEKFIQKRMKFLNLFINNVVKSESFKASEILYAFLTYDDRQKFESKLKEYQTKTPSSYVDEYQTLDGIISISLDEKNEKYFANISKYFNIQNNILDKVNYNLKMLNHNMSVVTELIKVIQKNFEVLHMLNTRVMMKPTITKAYEEIACFFKNWGIVLTKQKDLIKNNIKDFFKFINLEGKAYTELIVRREDLKEKYNAENTRVTNKKEKVFATGDINKFEMNLDDKSIDRERLMKDKVYAFEHICHSDTKNLEKINEQLGYANKMNMRELRKIIKQYCDRFVNNIGEFDQQFYPTINDLLSTYTNMETYVMTSKVNIK
jgi:hypothetical protein